MQQFFDARFHLAGVKVSDPRACISPKQACWAAPTRLAVATIFRAALAVTTIGSHKALTPRVRARTLEDPRCSAR